MRRGAGWVFRSTLCDLQAYNAAMKPLTLIVFVCAVLSVTPFAFGQGSSDVEKTLRGLDQQWAAAFAAKDVDKSVSYYSDDAIVLPPNTPAVTSKDAIRAAWKGMIDSGATLTWSATRVAVSKSGDMAYVSGTYQLSGKDASGKPTSDKGKYLTVWEKKGDGSWKCGADTWNSDQAVATAAK